MNANTNPLYLPEDPFEGDVKGLYKLLSARHAHETKGLFVPGYVEPSKGRFLRLALRQGTDELRSAEIQRIYNIDSLLSYKWASRKFFGVETSVQGIMVNYLYAAMMGHEADKQALTLIGPPGAGKSDLVEEIKNIYRTSEPIPFLAGSPVHANPLSLLFIINRVARKKGKGKLAATRECAAEMMKALELDQLINWDEPAVLDIVKKYDIDKNLAGLAKIPRVDDFVDLVVFGMGLPKAIRNNIGKPDPYSLDRVLGEYNTEDLVDLASFPIDNMFFDEGGNGIVDVAEVQPINFDLSKFIGQRNIGKMGKFKSLDPRAVELIGAYCRANRGLLIQTEGLKNPVEAQRINLEALQGHRIPLPEPLQDDLFWEGWVIVHSNEGEYDRFRAEKVNEPYWDRFLRVLFKYPLETSEAARISKKLWAKSDFSKPVDKGGVHKEPILDEYEAMLRVFSYMEDDKNGVPAMSKLKAYNGKQVRDRMQGTVLDVSDLRARASWREGMTGLSPRETAKEGTGALAAEALQLLELGKVPGACVTTQAFRKRFLEVIKLNITDEKTRKRLESFLVNDLEEWRRRELSRFVKAAFIEEFSSQCQSAFDKYIDWSNAAALGTMPKAASGFGRISSMEVEGFLREIESDPDWGVTSSQAKTFRQEIGSAYSNWIREHGAKNVPYTIHEGIKNCIERYVLKQVSGVARILTSATAQSDEDKRKLAGAKKRLIEQHNFCEHCAEELLREVEHTRSFLKE